MTGDLRGLTNSHLRRRPTIGVSKQIRVIDAYDYLNERYFDDLLVRPRIRVWKDLVMVTGGKKIPLSGAYSPNSTTDNKPAIWLRYLDGDQLGTLYHEMVHQSVYDLFMGNHEHHGALFWSIHDGLLRGEKLECLDL